LTIVVHSRPYVIGVDCDARTHTYAIIDTRTGQQLGCEQFPASGPGIARAITWVGQRTGGDADALWVIEGVASYCAALAHVVTDAGYEVVAFASLAGVGPIPASSGNTTRHRLNRGGDRRLNRAPHIAVLVRMTHDPDTRTYVENRLQEGRTRREIRRALKRYLAGGLYRSLNALHQPSLTTGTADASRSRRRVSTVVDPGCRYRRARLDEPSAGRSHGRFNRQIRRATARRRERAEPSRGA
jgi:hypothetical protein